MCAASCRTASATATGEPVITLHMEAYLGAPESYDAVEITGSPALKMKIAGGVHGDIATASIVVNSLPKILEVAPGLHTMRDMPLPSFFGGAVGSGSAQGSGRSSTATRDLACARSADARDKHGSAAAHRARVGHLRESFAEANERLVARLRGADDDAAERVPERRRVVGGADRVARGGRDDAVCRV